MGSMGPDNQGCGIKGFIPTSVSQRNLPLYMGLVFGIALVVVSQKWSFPATLLTIDLTAIGLDLSTLTRVIHFLQGGQQPSS